MLGRFRQKPLSQRLVAGLVALVLASSLASCGDRASDGKNFGIIRTSLAEVAPPEIISDLHQISSIYRPKVKITSPKPDEVLKDTTASINFQVEGLPIFKDPDLGLGSHLNVKVDDRPSQEVYDLQEPLIVENLAPGSHKIRVLANTAWNESFKNEGAYEQTTFHVLTKGTGNKSDRERPPITYNSPQGDYSIQPLLLDFYVNNLNKGDRVDKVKVTVNGEEFTLDNLEPIYLQGFKNGKNWVKIEPLNEDGKVIIDSDKYTLGAVNYQSNIESPLAKLLDSNLSVDEALKIVDPKYRPEPVEEIEVTETPKVERSPDLTPSEAEPKGLEKTQPTATVVPIIPSVPIPSVAPTSEILPEKMREDIEKIESTPTPTLEPTPTPEPKPSPKGSFLDRFRRQAETPAPVVEASPSTPAIIPIPTPTPTTIPPIEVTPEVEALPQPSPTSGFFQRFRRSADKSKAVTPPAVVETPTPEVKLEPTPTVLETPEVQPTIVPDTSDRFFSPAESSPSPAIGSTPEIVIESPKTEEKPTPSFLDRLRNRSTPKPEVSPTPTVTNVPEIVIPSPSAEETPGMSLIERLKSRSDSNELETAPTPSTVENPESITESPQVEKKPTSSFLDRLRNRATPKLEVSPTPTVTNVPEVVVPSPTVEQSPASSLIDRLKKRSSSSNVEIAPTPKVVAEPRTFEPKLEPTPSIPTFNRSAPETLKSPTEVKTSPINDSQNLLERLVPSSTKRMRLETEDGTTEVKAEKLPIIQVTPETTVPSRYFRRSENTDVELGNE